MLSQFIFLSSLTFGSLVCGGDRERTKEGPRDRDLFIGLSSRCFLNNNFDEPLSIFFCPNFQSLDVKNRLARLSRTIHLSCQSQRKICGQSEENFLFPFSIVLISLSEKKKKNSQWRRIRPQLVSVVRRATVKSPRPHVNPFRIFVKLYDLNWTINFVRVQRPIRMHARSKRQTPASRRGWADGHLKTGHTTHTPIIFFIIFWSIFRAIKGQNDKFLSLRLSSFVP